MTGGAKNLKGNSKSSKNVNPQNIWIHILPSTGGIIEGI
jgi:hypothetical protein